MTPEQIQDIVMGTMHAALDMGDLVPPALPQQGSFGMEEQGGMPEAPEMGGMPEAPEMGGGMPEMPPQQPMPLEGLME